MKIHTILSSKHLVNQYLIEEENEKLGILVDCSSVDNQLISRIEGKMNLVGVLITHSHLAHVDGLGTLFKIYSPTVYAYRDKIEGIECKALRDEDEISIGSIKIKALHIPGHSIDCISYLVDNIVFTGDTLESGSIGMTESLISKELMIDGIRKKLFVLDDNTLIFPGHGSPSKIRIEKMFNQDMLEAEATSFS